MDPEWNDAERRGDRTPSSRSAIWRFSTTLSGFTSPSVGDLARNNGKRGELSGRRFEIKKMAVVVPHRFCEPSEIDSHAGPVGTLPDQAGGHGLEFDEYRFRATQLELAHRGSEGLRQVVFVEASRTGDKRSECGPSLTKVLQASLPISLLGFLLAVPTALNHQ